MGETSIIAVLITAITALTGAVVYLYKRGERRDKEMRELISDIIQRNTILAERMEQVLIRVESLLKNWRGH